MAFFSQPEGALRAEGLPSWTLLGGRPWLLSWAILPPLQMPAQPPQGCRPWKRGRVPRPP